MDEHSPTYCDTPGELPQIVFAGCFCYARQRQRAGVSGGLIHCPPDSAKCLDASQGHVTVQLSRDAKPCPVRKAQLGKQERRKSECSFYNIGFELIILVLAGKTERKKKKKSNIGLSDLSINFLASRVILSTALIPRAAGSSAGTTWGYHCHMHPFDVKSKGERGLWLYLPLGAGKTVAQRQTLCPLSSPGSSCKSGDRAVFPKLTLLGMLRRKTLSRGPRGLRGNGSWAMGSLSTSFVAQTAATHGCDVFNKCLHFLS